MDDPEDGRKPTIESLAPLELFLHQAAMAIENAELIKNLKDARKLLEAYTSSLEQKVEERTHQLKESQEQLLRAQRMAVIGELAGMVGHDLRNPLTSIGGAAYYLKRHLAGTPRRTMEMLDLIENNISLSNKIINDLLDYSREVKLDLTDNDPKTIVRLALSCIQIPKDIQLITMLEDHPRFRADSEKLRRVFLNMVKNAIDAMPGGGKLTLACTADGDQVIFRISDTGVGMSEETIRKVWTPLFTTKAKGMGFGLPICKRFVEAHEGSITVKSALNKGTTFIVALPINPKTEDGGDKIWIKLPESLSLTTTKT
jgi:signal transduction histidine kinase